MYMPEYILGRKIQLIDHYVMYNTGKVIFLINLISGHIHGMQGSINIQSNRVVAEAVLAAVEEIWWMIAFLTAKEEVAVEVCLRHELVAVSWRRSGGCIVVVLVIVALVVIVMAILLKY